MREATTTRRSSYLIAFLALFLIVAIQSMVWSFSNNPPLGKTGASGEGTCADCHGGGAGAERLRLPRRLELSINPASNIT
jgi:hypothetical protein